MRLIIDIPDDVYERTQENRYVIYDKMYNAIRNGTPLPKGHGRLKDVDYIKLFSIDHDCWNGVEYEGVIKVVPVIAIDNASTIIEADKEV